MEAFITNDSALEFWRLYRRSKKDRVFPPCRRRPPGESPSSFELHRGDTWNLTLPLDLMVGSRGARRPSEAVRPHVCTKHLPDGSFVNAEDGLVVSSPEFCFFQMAGEYPLAKLIALGLEFCGSYSLPAKTSEGADRDEPAQALYNLPKLSSQKKLKAFVARMEGWDGYDQATKALQYIADGSASPMETTLCILLTLPYRYGGYGFPLPELNGRINPEKGAKKFAGRGFYIGDLLWREAGVVAEYNSDTEHTGPERIARDAIRRGDLELCGIYEVTVTKRQLFDAELFDKVAKQISKKSGKRLRYKDPGFSKACRELRSLLL